MVCIKKTGVRRHRHNSNGLGFYSMRVATPSNSKLKSTTRKLASRILLWTRALPARSLQPNSRYPPPPAPHGFPPEMSPLTRSKRPSTVVLVVELSSAFIHSNWRVSSGPNLSQRLPSKISLPAYVESRSVNNASTVSRRP